MKIIKTELFVFDISYREPFHISVQTTSKKKGLLVKITTKNGLIGYGEAAPTKYVTHETIQTCKKTFLTYLFPAIKGLNADDIAAAHKVMNKAIKDAPSAKTAIDMALYDIAAKAKGLPLYKYLGGKKDRIQTDMTISIKSPEHMAQSAKKFVKKGFGILKIKLGTTPVKDIERIKLIRDTVGPAVKIRVDANQGWKDYKIAAKLINELEKYDIELVEQPLPKNDFIGFKKLKKLVNIPIAADEIAQTLSDVKRLISDGSVDIVNIKLMKCAGIYHGIEIVKYCKKHNVACMIGGMCETKVAVAASAHLACSNDNFKYADLDGDLLLDDKLVTKASIGLKNGYRTLADYPGLGIIKLNERILTKLS